MINRMKKQVIIIGGGNTFDTYKQYVYFLKKLKVDFGRMKMIGWKESLGKDLGRGFEVILPKMPNPNNAKYAEWKIWWEKIIPYLEKQVVLIGHSLGGIFLTKYLSENKFPKNILAVFLIAAPYDDKGEEDSLADFKLKKDLSLIQEQSGKVFFYHSEDDGVVRFSDLGKYKKALPQAICREFKNKGHFNQAKFPELVREIRKNFA